MKFPSQNQSSVAHQDWETGCKETQWQQCFRGSHSTDLSPFLSADPAEGRVCGERHSAPAGYVTLPRPGERECDVRGRESWGSSHAGQS